MAETNVDSILGKIVVESNLCTEKEVQHCLKRMKDKNLSDSTNGKILSLAEALVTNGFLTQSQLTRVRKVVEDSRPTQQIPGFQILEKLGAGAMATVFKARQVSLDRYVAIKVLPKRLSENPEYVERFYKEGKAAAKLNHRNIVQAIDVGEAGGYHYFVMEYVKGKTVYDDLAANKVYSEADAIDIILQITDALIHAHAKGLIHRDVKPKNVMITEDGVAKLADMGLAREAADTEAAKMEAGRAYGTPYYISPEQIRGEVDIDFRADIYSLGAMLYHMVTGKVPFEASTPSAVMHKHLKEQLVPPDHINRSLSVGIAEVIETMMAKKRKDRYPSAQTLKEDLMNIKEGMPPLHAHKDFDPNMLDSLETSGTEMELDIDDVANMQPQQLGLKIAVIILSGLLGIAVLVIFLLLNKGDA